MKTTLLIATAVTVGLAMTAPAKADRILLQMLGQATSIGNLDDASFIAEIDVDIADVNDVIDMNTSAADYACFEMPLLDPDTKVQLGTGIDCLFFLGPDPTDGVAAVSFFNLPGGSIVNAGLTSLGLFVGGVGDNPIVPGDPSSPNPVVMTGSIPNLTNDSIVAANGDFNGYVGTGRVSGAVAPGDEFWFNCMWEINLQPNPGFANAAARGNNRN